MIRHFPLVQIPFLCYYYNMNTKNRFFTTYDLILSAFFIALITVGAFIKIPIGPVPITLQFMFVLLAGQLLNPKSAVLSLTLYTAMGLMGFPVFSGGGGLSYVLTPTFGYIVGFVFASMAVSLISHNGKNTFLKFLFANLAGFAVVYVCGLGYYILLSNFYFDTVLDIGTILLAGFVVFIPTDITFCVLIALLSKRLSQILEKYTA